MSIKISSRKQKARILQYWTCEKISELLNIPWRQDDDSSLIKSRPMGQSGVDVILIGEALERFPFSVECKSYENWSLQPWIEQAKTNQKNGTDWLLIIKQSRKSPIVVMDGETFFKLMNDYKKLEREKK